MSIKEILIRCIGRCPDVTEAGESMRGELREALRLYREERDKSDERFELVLRNKQLYMDALAALKARVEEARDLLGDCTQSAHPRLANVYRILCGILEGRDETQK